MSESALALVLAAALFHALWNFAAKRVPHGGAIFVWLYFAASTALWVPITLIWAVTHPLDPTWYWLLGSAVSAILHIVYSVVLQRGYAVGDLNLVYPLARGTGPLLTLLFSILVLRQDLASSAILGALLVVAGVLVIAIGRSPAGHPHPRRLGIIYGVGTGVTIAAYTLWDNHSVNALAVPPLPYFTIGLILQTAFLGPTVWPQRQAARPMLRAHWREVMAIAVLSPLAYILVLQAMRMAPVALVASARETSIVIGSLIGWLVLREPHPARRLAGTVLVLGGIVALVAG